MGNLVKPSPSNDEPVLVLRVAYWFLFLGLMLVGLGSVALYYAFENFPTMDYELLLYGVGLTSFFGFAVYYMIGRRVVVYSDRLISTTRFSVQSASLDEVIGTVSTQDFFRVLLESSKAIKVPWYLKNAFRLRKHLNAIIEERGIE